MMVSRKKKILFVLNNDTQVKNIAPIVRKLQRHPKIELLAISLDNYDDENSANWLRRKDIPFVLLEKTQNIKKFLFRKLLTIIEAKKSITKVFREENPDLVIFGNDYLYLNRMLIHIANSERVKTLLIQDGVIKELDEKVAGIAEIHNKFMAMCKKAKKLFKKEIYSLFNLGYLADSITKDRYGTCGCNMIAAFGLQPKELFVKRGVPPERIRIVGVPRYDDFMIHKQDHSGSLIYEKIFSNTKRNIIWANGILEFEPLQKLYGFASFEKYLNTIFSEMKRSDQYNFIVKLHPRNKMEVFQSIRKDVNAGNIKIIQDCEMSDLLPHADAFVAYSSTTILEAFVFGVPVALVNFLTCPSTYLRDKEILDIVFLINRHEEMADVLKKLLSGKQNTGIDKKRKAYLSKNIYHLDGKASERTYDLILEVLGLRNRS